MKRARTESKTVYPPRRRRTGPKSSKTVTIPRNVKVYGTGFPSQLIVKHRYVEPNITLTSTTGGYVSYVVSCNGMFDPNITGTGKQPSYFDTMSSIYNHYNVISSKVTFRGVADASQVLEAAAYIEDGASPVSTFTNLLEQPSCTKSQFIMGFTNVGKFSLGWNAKKAFGPDADSNTQLQGSSSANPTEQQYYVIGINGVALTTANLRWTVDVEYTAVWRELKDIATS